MQPTICSIPCWLSQTIAVLTALTPIAIGALGIWIAVRQVRIAQQQARTAANKLKLDLFDRRIAIYDAAHAFVVEVMRTGTSDLQQQRKFYSSTRGATWLFDPAVTEYLDKTLWEKATRLEALVETMNVADDEQRAENIRQQTEIKLWFAEQLGELERRFSPFLKLSH
ncbi:MAG TPA: hypothetical protein VFB32_06295 [Rudaea sp.]|nr:hypothetical protein [Rudaea sp.]